MVTLTDPRAAEVEARLTQVIDPEVGLDIVRMGLIYGIAVQDEAVEITMTFSTPGCPLVGALSDGIHAVVSELPWVTAVAIQVVWDPPWHPGMIHPTKGDTP